MNLCFVIDHHKITDLLTNMQAQIPAWAYWESLLAKRRREFVCSYANYSRIEAKRFFINKKIKLCKSKN